MKLSIKNPLVWFFHQCFTIYPSNICSLFWGTLLNLLFFFITIPGIILNAIFRDPDPAWSKGAMFLVINLACILFGSRLSEQYFEKSIWWAWVCGVGIVISAGVLIFGLIMIGIYLHDRKEKRRAGAPPKEETFYVRDTWAAVTNKYCTKIEIIDKP